MYQNIVGDSFASKHLLDGVRVHTLLFSLFFGGCKINDIA